MNAELLQQRLVAPVDNTGEVVKMSVEIFRTAPCVFDIPPLTVPDQREHVLNRVGRQQRLAEQDLHLQPMHRQ